MTGELCSQPPLGVADTRLPYRSATSTWHVSPLTRPSGRTVGSPKPSPSGAEAPKAVVGSTGPRPVGLPGRRSRLASAPTSARRAALYSSLRRASIGTSVWSGSPYHASRSAKASLATSVTMWM